MRYRFTQTYKSSYGAGVEGDEVDLSETEADGINRDAPSTLVSADAAPEPTDESTEQTSADADEPKEDDESDGDAIEEDAQDAKDEKSESEARTIDHAPNDRQVKKGQKRGRA